MTAPDQAITDAIISGSGASEEACELTRELIGSMKEGGNIDVVIVCDDGTEFPISCGHEDAPVFRLILPNGAIAAAVREGRKDGLVPVQIAAMIYDLEVKQPVTNRHCQLSAWQDAIVYGSISRAVWKFWEAQ